MKTGVWLISTGHGQQTNDKGHGRRATDDAQASILRKKPQRGNRPVLLASNSASGGVRVRRTREERSLVGAVGTQRFSQPACESYDRVGRYTSFRGSKVRAGGVIDGRSSPAGPTIDGPLRTRANRTAGRVGSKHHPGNAPRRSAGTTAN